LFVGPFTSTTPVSHRKIPVRIQSITTCIHVKITAVGVHVVIASSKDIPIAWIAATVTRRVDTIITAISLLGLQHGFDF
jgi:hypothetical protein